MFVQLTRELLGKKAGERIDLADPDAAALLQSGAATPVGDDALAPAVTRAFEQALGGIGGCVQSAVESALKDFAAASTRSRKNAVPAIFGPGGEGDPKRTFGRFLLAVRNHDGKALEEMGSRYVEWAEEGAGQGFGGVSPPTHQKAAMSTQTGVSGGYLVPVEFHARLMKLVTEKSIVRPRATVIPMTSRTVQIPALDVTTAPTAGDTAMLGGVVARWMEEATTLNETEPNLKQIDLTNYELSGYSKVSNTLLADSALGLEAFLMQIFSRAIAWYEDYGFLRGNGVAKPLGVQAWAGLVQVARNTANQFKLADVASLYAKLLPGGDAGSICWVVHPSVLGQLVQLTGGSNVLMLAGQNLGGPLTMSMLSYPIAVSEKVPALGSSNDVTLCDFQHYLKRILDVTLETIRLVSPIAEAVVAISRLISDLLTRIPCG